MELLPNSDISPFCINHIKLMPQMQSDDCEEMIRSKTDAENLEKLIPFFENYATKGMGFNIFKYEMPKDKYGYCHDYLFLVQKGLKLQSKYSELFQNYYADIFKQILLLILFMKDYYSKKFPVYCHVETLKADAFLDFTKKEEVSIILKKIEYISSALSKMKKMYIDIPTQDTIRSDLREAAKFIDAETEYLSETYFDEHFYDFLTSNKMILRFKKSAEQFKSKNQIDASESKQLSLNFYLFLEPSCLEEQLLIKCTTIRILFQVIYTEGVSFFNSSDDANKEFLIRSEQFSNLTPLQICISPDLLNPLHMNMSIREIVYQSQELRHALQIISNIPYYSNPVEIISLCHKAIKFIEEFIKLNKKAKNESTELLLSFDDIFSVFSSVITVDPSVSFVGIANFLKKIERMSLSSSFDYAKLLFISSIDFILETDPSTLNAQQTN